MKYILTVSTFVFLAGCGAGFLQKPVSAPADVASSDAEIRPVARPSGAGGSPPAEARTVEQFDTTSAAERATAARAPAQAAEVRLGTTIASLGDPAQPGFWLETPLVTSAAKGRVVFPDTGKSAQVDLIPGDASAGARISLAAMRLIGAPLTGLPEVVVYSGG